MCEARAMHPHEDVRVVAGLHNYRGSRVMHMSSIFLALNIYFSI